jgi:hypothetical protein
MKLTEVEVIQFIREHLDGLFPKICPNCKRRFATCREYLLSTKILGRPVSYDVDLGDWRPDEPLGTMALASCPCGDTLALSSEGMPLLRLWSLMGWAKAETQERHMTPEELLNYLCARICKQILGEPSPGGA